jgi:outer membrane immunogenic protein
MMKRLSLTGVGAVALATTAVGAASAADLARRMPLKAPPYVQPVYDWTGFYLGLNGGWGFGTSHWSGIPTSFNTSGGLIGGTAGYNMQYGQWVLGLEGDIDWADISGHSSACAIGDCRTGLNWLATVRGRVGWANDRFMPYITGGAAFGGLEATRPGFVGQSTTKAGWTLGAGLEVGLAGNWTGKIEYLYVDLGNFDCNTACSLAASNKIDFTANIVRAGLNYRF